MEGSFPKGAALLFCGGVAGNSRAFLEAPAGDVFHPAYAWRTPERVRRLISLVEKADCSRDLGEARPKSPDSLLAPEFGRDFASFRAPRRPCAPPTFVYPSL